MAVSTLISNARPRHRAARLPVEAFQGALALDWANGQVVTPGGSSAQSTAFDANNDRIVFVATSAATAWVTVAANPTASTGAAGNMPILTTQPAQPIYVPAGMLIAAIAASGNISMIPALIASDP